VEPRGSAFTMFFLAVEPSEQVAEVHLGGVVEP